MTEHDGISELHQPVLLERCIELLAPALDRPNSWLIDCTLGLGGHAEAFLERFPTLKLLGVDRDPAAIDLAEQRLARFVGRVQFAQVRFDELPAVLENLGLTAVDGVLFDLGVSSMQLDQADRGFAYSYDAPLDMRMDTERGLTAADILNGYSESALIRIFRDYGEERYAKQIAQEIIAERAAEPFTSSARLASLIVRIVPFIPGKSSGHPAKRVFQALRIEVNGELEALQAVLPAAIDALALGGRIVVLSYHSLEDAIVKRELVAAASSSAPLDLPMELPEHAPWLRMLVKGAERASDAEVSRNSRAASARLRAAEKIRVAA